MSQTGHSATFLPEERVWVQARAAPENCLTVLKIVHPGKRCG